jgi:hypothetical protein
MPHGLDGAVDSRITGLNDYGCILMVLLNIFRDLNAIDIREVQVKEDSMKKSFWRKVSASRPEFATSTR